MTDDKVRRRICYHAADLIASLSQSEGVMPQYVVIGNHAPSECPGANGKVREVWKKVLSEVPALRERHGIKLVAGPMHLDPSHKILTIVEASNPDSIQDYLMTSRLGQLMDMDLYRGSDLMALFAQAESSMPPLY